MPHERVIQQFGLAPISREVLGRTDRSQDDFHYFLNSIAHRFSQSTYDVFRNNCNHFTDEAVRFLLNGTGIPAEIVNLPDRFLATPMGQMLAPSWSSMQQRMQEQFVPFNAAQPSMALLPVSPSYVPSHTLQPQPTSSSSSSTTSTTTATRTVRVDVPQVPLMEAIRKLGEEASPKEMVLALDTLEKILKNIIANPHEEKFRKISVSNAKFHSTLGRFTFGIPCLLAIGFTVQTPERTHVVIAADPSKWDRLVMSEKIVSAARKKAIKSFVEKSSVTTLEQAYKLVDAQDPVVQEVVQSMFSAQQQTSDHQPK